MKHHVILLSHDTFTTLWMASENHMKTFISQCASPLDGKSHKKLFISQYTFPLANWNHMKRFISQCTFLLDDKRSHEWSWMPCVGTSIPIGCWKSNGHFQSYTYQHQMTYDIMMTSSSDVILYHIFVSERFCLHVLGLWLGVFNRLWISLVVWIFKGEFVGMKFVNLWHCDRWQSWLVPNLEGWLY